MATSYSTLQKQIDALKAKADALRLKEAGSVIARIKEAIAHYGLTMTDLFGGKGAGKRKAAKRASRGGARADARADARYADGQGNVWGGRGPRPLWLREALSSGKRLEDFDTRSASTPATSGTPRKAATAKKRRKGAVKFRDNAGNTWTGVGRKPRWFQEALASGKKPEDLAAS